MSRIPLFKPFPVQWSRMLGCYLFVIVAIQAMIYLTVKDDPATDYLPSNDPRWTLHLIEALLFHGPQYRFLTWLSVICIGIIAGFILIKPSHVWIKVYFYVELALVLPNIMLTVVFIANPGPVSESLYGFIKMWFFALVTSLIPMTLAIFISQKIRSASIHRS